MLLVFHSLYPIGAHEVCNKMSSAMHLQNVSFDKLLNGSVIEAAVSTYEVGMTFGGINWLWPFIFLMTLIMVAIKSENPTMVAIYAILGNVALATRLPQLTQVIFVPVVIFSILIWLYSIFVSPKIE